VILTLWNLQLVYVDDLHLLTAGPDKFLILWMVLAAYEVVGTPFAYHKFKGGVAVDYIGYHVSYATGSAGVSDSRARWVISWISNAEESDWIVVGRAMIELTGHRLVPAPVRPLKQLFRTVPWLFKEDGSSQWASSSAELLATYMACLAFAPDICVSECTITAGTDNRSNPQALEKGSSMKWPLMGLMMQFASYLASCGGRIKLQWRPREENIEADDLTNSRFDRFDLSLRVDVSFGDLPMSIFDSLQDAQAEFAELKAAQKLHTQKTAPTSKKQKLSEKTAW
ncbi:unnamed protein product, partial [Symbiodinium pilosum]